MFQNRFSSGKTLCPGIPWNFVFDVLHTRDAVQGQTTKGGNFLNLLLYGLDVVVRHTVGKGQLPVI